MWTKGDVLRLRQRSLVPCVTRSSRARPTSDGEQSSSETVTSKVVCRKVRKGREYLCIYAGVRGTVSVGSHHGTGSKERGSLDGSERQHIVSRVLFHNRV